MAETEHASSCYLPTSWMPLPLVEKKEYNYDSTLYVRLSRSAAAPLAYSAAGPLLLTHHGARR